MNSNGSSMVIGSTEGYVKVFDISRRYLLWCRMSMIIIDPIRFDREPRRLGKTLNINAYVPPVYSIRERAVNCNGSKVTVLTTQVRRRENLSFQAMSCCFISSLDQLESEQSIVSLECQERSGEELRFCDRANTRHRIWSHSKERQPRQECSTVSSLSIERALGSRRPSIDGIGALFISAETGLDSIDERRCQDQWSASHQPRCWRWRFVDAQSGRHGKQKWKNRSVRRETGDLDTTTERGRTQMSIYLEETVQEEDQRGWTSIAEVENQIDYELGLLPRMFHSRKNLDMTESVGDAAHVRIRNLLILLINDCSLSLSSLFCRIGM